MHRPVTRVQILVVAIAVSAVIFVFGILPHLVADYPPVVRLAVLGGAWAILIAAALYAVYKESQSGPKRAPETGKIAVVRGPFEHAGGTIQGKVFVKGEIWSAVADCDPSLLPVGSECRVVDREGQVLRVEPS